jgi:hypothetical protein
LVCRQKEPLIRAAFGALIGADPRNEVSANQRFLLSGKVVHVKLNHYQMAASGITVGCSLTIRVATQRPRPLIPNTDEEKPPDAEESRTY